LNITVTVLRRDKDGMHESSHLSVRSGLAIDIMNNININIINIHDVSGSNTQTTHNRVNRLVSNNKSRDVARKPRDVACFVLRPMTPPLLFD